MVLVQRPKETPFNWARRKYCSRECNAKSRQAWGYRIVSPKDYRVT